MKLDLSIAFDRNKATVYFNKLLSNQEKIELKKHQPRRSKNQNAYWHVACTILSEETGYTVDEIKTIIKDQLEFMTYTKNCRRFYRSSLDLNTIEFANLIEFTKSFAESNGYYIPTPDEYYDHQFDVEKQLQL